VWLENRSEAEIRALARDTKCVTSGADTVPVFPDALSLKLISETFEKRAFERLF